MTNTNETFGDLLDFFQQNRMAISRAEKIRGQVLDQIPDALRRILSPQYNIWCNTGARREGWVVLHRNENTRFKYVMGYYSAFHDDEFTPTYRIELMAENGSDPAKKWQSEMLATEHAKRYNLEADDRHAHHILGKTYSLGSGDLARFPQLLAEKLLAEWQPLESLWPKLADTESRE